MHHKIIQSRMKWAEDLISPSIVQSIVNGESALIEYKFVIVTCSSIICGKFKNARLKIASENFFLSAYGMAFRKGFDQDFKRKINKL